MAHAEGQYSSSQHQDLQYLHQGANVDVIRDEFSGDLLYYDEAHFPAAAAAAAATPLLGQPIAGDHEAPFTAAAAATPLLPRPAARELPLAPARQPKSEWMTLEDFLVDVGVVQRRRAPESCSRAPSGPLPMTAQPSFKIRAGPSSGQAAGVACVGGGGIGRAPCHWQRGGGGILIGGRAPAAGMDAMSSRGLKGEQVEELEWTATRSCRGKRAVDTSEEAMAERQKRRMIKNRESAARSRAKKQAYAADLFRMVEQMKEENACRREKMEKIWQQLKQKVLHRPVDTAAGEDKQTPAPSHHRHNSCSW